MIRQHMGQRLNVVDDRRLAPQPALRRERRLGPRHAALAFDRGDHRRLFAADKCARAFHHLAAQRQAGAEDVLAQESARFRVLTAPAHALDGQRVFGADVDAASRPRRWRARRSSALRCTLCGLPSITLRFMNAPGSPSSPLQITYFFVGFWIRAASHLRPVGKPPPPRPRKPGVQDGLANLFGRHLQEGFLRRRIAALVHEFANVFGVEKSALVQHKAALAGVERIVLDALAALACRRIFVEKPFDDLMVSQSLLHNLGNVFFANLGVKNAVGNYRDQRSHLAKTLASAFRQANLIAGGFGAQFKNHLQTGVAISLLNCSKTFMAPLAMHPVPAQMMTRRTCGKR